MDSHLLRPEDEFPHQPDGSSNFNESVYANGFDRLTGVGGWMRIGNRVNEGHAETSVVLYLPGGRIACAFARPPITSNAAFDAGGLRVDTLAPLTRQRMTYEGEAMLLSNPQLLRDPERLFRDSERAPTRVIFEQTADSPTYGGVPLSADAPTLYGRDFSLGHFNQHTRVAGEIIVGDESWPIEGAGWRDHSWGPRYWTNIFAYRLFLANFGAGRALMLLKIFSPDGRARSEGVLMVDGVYEPVADLNVVTDWTSQYDPRRMRIGVRTARRSALIEAEVLSSAPLRNRRREGEQTHLSRIAECFTQFRWDGAEAWGMAEYIERIDGDRPVLWPL